MDCSHLVAQGMLDSDADTVGGPKQKPRFDARPDDAAGVGAKDQVRWP